MPMDRGRKPPRSQGVRGFLLIQPLAVAHPVSCEAVASAWRGDPSRPPLAADAELPGARSRAAAAPRRDCTVSRQAHRLMHRRRSRVLVAYPEGSAVARSSPCFLPSRHVARADNDSSRPRRICLAWCHVLRIVKPGTHSSLLPATRRAYGVGGARVTQLSCRFLRSTCGSPSFDLGLPLFSTEFHGRKLDRPSRPTVRGITLCSRSS